MRNCFSDLRKHKYWFVRTFGCRQLKTCIRIIQNFPTSKISCAGQFVNLSHRKPSWKSTGVHTRPLLWGNAFEVSRRSSEKSMVDRTIGTFLTTVCLNNLKEKRSGKPLTLVDLQLELAFLVRHLCTSWPIYVNASRHRRSQKKPEHADKMQKCQPGFVQAPKTTHVLQSLKRE